AGAVAHHGVAGPLQEVEDGAHVEVDVGAELVAVEEQDGLDVPAARHHHGDVEAPLPVGRRVDGRSDGVAVEGVAHEPGDVRADATEIGGGRLQRGLRPSADGDGGAVTGKTPGRAEADARAAAHHDGPAAGERAVHASVLPGADVDAERLVAAD